MEAVKEMKLMNEEIHVKVEAVKEINERVEASSRETKQEIGEVKKEVKNMKDNLFKVNKDVDEVKVMMTQVLEKLNMLELPKKQPSPAEEKVSPPRQVILVAGGYDGRNGNRSTEIYSWEKNGWLEVSSMNEKHDRTSSSIDKDQIFVVGGFCSKAIESLDINNISYP